MTRRSFRLTRLLVFVLFLASCSSGVRRELPTIEDAAPPAGTFETLAATNGSTTVSVVNSIDDAEETVSGGAVNLANAALTLGAKSGAAQIVGFRFQNVGIPRGATITSAFLEVKAAAASSAAATFTIKGEKSDSPIGYRPTAGDLSPRAKTAAAVSWTPAVWTSGTAYRSADLVNIVREIVAQSGWYQGNALALQLTGANTTSTRSVTAFDGGAANAPKLIVNFTYDPAVSPVYLSRSVAAGTDDAKQPNTATAAAIINSTVLELGQNGATAQTVGLRFPNLTIPPGATIHKANLIVTSTAANSSTTNYTITAEASDAAAPFTTAANNLGARAKVANPASVAWPTGAFAASTAYGTVSIAPLLKQLVDRPGWRSGNAAAFFISGTGTRPVVAFEGGAANAARLVVNYTPAATPPPNPCSSLNGTLPSPWTGGDVGTVSAAGKAGSASNVFDLCGYGAGLTASADSFQFVRQTLSGDGTLTARLTSLDAATATARAGLMVRESTAANAKYAALYVDGANAKAFVNRGGTVAPAAAVSVGGLVGEVFRSGEPDVVSSAAGGIFGEVQNVASPDGQATGVFDELGGVAGTLAPQANRLTTTVWLRVTRKGTALTSYTSTDGQTWTPAGTTTLALASSVQVGLFSTGQGSTTPATAKFDNVVLGPVIEDPSSGPLPAFGVAVASNYGSVSFTPASATAVTLSAASPVWNAGSRSFTADVTMRNTSSTRTYTGVRAILGGFNPATTTNTKPSGYTSDNKPFVEFGTLAPGASKTLSWRFHAPEGAGFSLTASLIETDGLFDLTGVSPGTMASDATTTVTVSGQGIRAETAFFIQSTKLAVSSWTATSAALVVPAGFPAATYGIMAVNPDGSRTTLYPGLTITPGAPPPAIDPAIYSQSFITGYVTDFISGEGIAGAKVSIPGLEATTVSSGSFLLRGVPPGRHAVKIEAPGYEPVYRFAEVIQTANTLTLELATLERTDPKVTNIGPTGGTHRASNGAFLVVPPGALDDTVPIGFTHTRAAGTLPELPEDGYYLAFAHLGPAGLAFNKPATLFLPLQEGIVLTPGTPIKISYFDEKDKRWVQDITSGVIAEVEGKLYLEYEINHFTWIGGQFFPDPVTGCVTYSDGTPAPGVVTNWGTTDANGVFRGSTTQSDTGRTLRANVVGYASTPVSLYYSGDGPVSFPCIVINENPEPVPEDIFFVPEFDECSVSARELDAFGERRRTVEAAGGDYRQLVFRETAGTLQAAIPYFTQTNTDLADVRIKVGGIDATDLADITLTPGGDLSVVLDLDALDLPSGMDIEASIEATRRTGQRFVSTTKANIVANVRVPNVSVVSLPDSMVPADVSTPYIEETEHSTAYIFRASDLTAINGQDSVVVEVAAQTVDDNGNVLPINANDAFVFPNLDSSSNVLTEGVSRISLTVPIGEDEVTELDLSKVAVSALSASSYGTNSLADSGTLGCPQVVTTVSNTGDSPVLKATPKSFWDKVLKWFGDEPWYVTLEMAKFIWQALPLAGDGTDLLYQLYQTYFGRGGDWVSAFLSSVGLIMDLIPTAPTQAAGVMASALKGLYKLSSAGSGTLAKAIGDTLGEIMFPPSGARVGPLEAIEKLGVAFGPGLELLSKCGPLCVNKADGVAAKLANDHGFTPSDASKSVFDSVGNYDGPASGLLDDLGDPPNSQIDEVINTLACSFSADTLVATEQGLVPISQITTGDRVLGFHEQQGGNAFYTVTDTWAHEDPVTISLSIGGETIETTPEHPFYVNGSWVAAQEITVGMAVTDSEGDATAVTGMERVDRPQVMYNLTVEEAHTYFVGEGEWLVHNACSSTLDNALGGVKGDKLQAHHLIPGELEPGKSRAHPLLTRAMSDPNDPWKIDSGNNGEHLPSEPGVKNAPLHRSNHPAYTNSVERRLNALEAEERAFITQNGRPWTQQELKQKLDGVSQEYRTRLGNMGSDSRVPARDDEVPADWP